MRGSQALFPHPEFIMHAVTSLCIHSCVYPAPPPYMWPLGHTLISISPHIILCVHVVTYINMSPHTHARADYIVTYRKTCVPSLVVMISSWAFHFDRVCLRQRLTGVYS